MNTTNTPKTRVSKKNTHYRITSIDDIKLEKDRKNAPVKSDVFKIKGWAFDKHSYGPAKTVWLEINGKDYKTTYGLQRKSVAKRFGNKVLEKTGFVRMLNKADFEVGRHRVKVKVLSSDGNEIFIKPHKPTFFTIK